ncbi:unnamed protein product [Phytophthora fragariaefolia]|uniref:Unnamed protein product n=1 Tax=Phytophthora fragariaefolia TaxID=1490495 RepID=A0A9W6Y7N2_9STRA|nr:unnamed protein product [Phytophthora fragariaefolia]
MYTDALSPRHRGSPLTRRNRDILPPTNNCLEVQWRFLQHKPPKPPLFGLPQRKPLLAGPIHSPSLNASVITPRKHLDPDSTRDSPSRLFHMFEVQDVEAEDFSSMNVLQPSAQQSNVTESPRTSRTLNDLMGETQRQAMLDRILADMEYLSVEPTHPRLGQADDDKKATSPRNPQRARGHKPSILQTALKTELNSSLGKQHKFNALWSLSSQGGYSDDVDDDDDDDEIFDDDANGAETDGGGHGLERSKDRKRRQRRKIQQFNQEVEGPRIFWQKTSGARSAADVPERLLTMSPSPPQRMRSAHIVLGRRSYTPRQILSSSGGNEGHQRNSRNNLTAESAAGDQPASSTKNSTSKMSPRRRRRHKLLIHAAATSPGPSSATTAPVSPPRAQYGAWYVPQSQWWTLHQIEQQTVDDRLPASATPTPDLDEPHCHGASTSPSQRQHKPPLPPAALSPRTVESNHLSAAKPALQALRGSHLIHAHAPGSMSSSRIPSASSRSSAAPPSAPGPLELQVAGIPQSYIGREYRAYIISTGTTVPPYLQ